MKLITKLMYFQGLCIEDPDTEPELEFYLQFYQPRLARLLVRYWPLRLALKLLRKGVSFVAMATTSAVVILSAMAIWKHKTDHIIVIQNAFCIFMCIPTIVVMSLYLFQSEKINFITGELERISREVERDGDTFLEMLKTKRQFWDSVARYSIFLVIPIFAVLITVVHVVNLVPNRKQWESLWYPYDETRSPFYEITIVIRWIQIVSNAVSTVTIVIVSCANLSELIVHFKILVDTLENIREYSIKKILAGKCITNCEMDVISVVKAVVKTEDVDQSSNRKGMHLENVYSIDEDHVTINIKTDEGLIVRRKPILSGSQLESVFAEIEIEQLVREIEMPDSSDEVISAGNLECVTCFEPEVQHFELLTVEHFNQNITSTSKEDLVEEPGYTSEELDDMMRRNLIQCLKIHQTLLNVAKSFASAANMTNIVVFVNVVTLYGATIVLFSQDNMYVSHSVYVVMSGYVIMTYFVFSYMMNLVTDQSVAVGESMYTCDWTGASPVFKRNMLILMTRANVPVQFKPSGLEPLSLHNFGVVSKIAYKMAMSMRDIANAKRN